MLIQSPDSFTPREIETMRYEKEREEAQMAHYVKIKELDIELAKMEAKISILLRIPLIIVKLPVLILFGIAYIVHAIVKIEPSENFWKLLK